MSPHPIVSTEKTSLPAFLYRLNVVEIIKIAGYIAEGCGELIKCYYGMYAENPCCQAHRPFLILWEAVFKDIRMRTCAGTQPLAGLMIWNSIKGCTKC
jgi:hypothetical protein